MFRGLEPQLEGEEPRILIEEEDSRQSDTLALVLKATISHLQTLHLWISITSSAIMRPIFPAPARVPPGMPGTVCSARLPPPAKRQPAEQVSNGRPTACLPRAKAVCF